jgi:hypothetical protein
MKCKSIFAIGIVAVYCAVITFAPILDRLVLFPTTARIDPGRAQRKAGGVLI